MQFQRIQRHTFFPGYELQSQRIPQEPVFAECLLCIRYCPNTSQGLTLLEDTDMKGEGKVLLEHSDLQVANQAPTALSQGPWKPPVSSII